MFSNGIFTPILKLVLLCLNPKLAIIVESKIEDAICLVVISSCVMWEVALAVAAAGHLVISTNVYLSLLQ